MMGQVYLNVPYVGEALLIQDGTRGRTWVDGSTSLDLPIPGVEVWIGPWHLTLDAPRKRPSRGAVLALVLWAWAGSFLEWGELFDPARELVTGSVSYVSQLAVIHNQDCVTEPDCCRIE